QAFHQQLVALAESVDPDGMLATALHEAQHTLLAFSFVAIPGQHSGAATAPPPPFLSASAYRALQYAGPEPPRSPLGAGDLLLPMAPLAPAAQGLGHVKVGFDTDGTPRYEYPVVPHQDFYYPPLAVQAVRLYMGLALEEVQVRFGDGIQLGDIFM